VKPQLNEQGEKEKDTVTTSQALQIGGRAGWLTNFDEFIEFVNVYSF
jgi:hypothetical protein